MSSRKNATGKDTVLFYVSTQGCDRWSGRQIEPTADGKDGPFATITAARDAIRKLKKNGLKAPVKVLVRGGTYTLDETLTFEPADSGTDKHPVVYAAYPGEVPVFSGGRRISGWKTATHKGKTCWIADLPTVKSGAWNFTQLFANGERRYRPRLPKKDFYRFTGFVSTQPETGGWYKGPSRMNFAKGEIKNWKNLADVELTAYQLWYETHHRIKKVDDAKRVVEFRNHSIGSLKDEKNLPARYIVENVFEALDTPGEWYLDRPAGKLFYLPLPGEDPQTLDVVAPVLEKLVHFRGDKKSQVQHIRLENLVFSYAEWHVPPTYAGDAQASFSVPGAIFLDKAEDCVLYGCEVSHISQYAVDVLGAGCSNNKIVACVLRDLGAGGVKVGHEELRRKDETTGKPIPTTKDLKAARTTVSDCSIYDGGRIYPSAIGIWVGNSGRNRIRHNHIHHMRYTGISCGWTWGYHPTRTVDNRIEYNHIHHINHDGLLSDNGGIYTLGPQPGTIIRGNLIHDIACYGYGGWGIYPDEGSSQEVIENNVVHRTQGPAYFTHYGRDNVARNNIFALTDDQHIIPGSRMEDHRTTIVERNIIYWKKGNLWFGNWQIDHTQFRDNLFWAGGRPVDFSLETVEFWQKHGQLLNTVIADPLFVDPESGDFSLREDSPALKLGFKPIDASKAGPRFAKVRPLSFDELVETEESREIVYAQMEIVQSIPFDAKRKPGKVRLTLTNVGEIPASGKVKFLVRPDGAGRLIGANGFAYALKPGATKSIEVSVATSPSAEKVIVETVPVGKGLVPSFVIAKKPRVLECRVPRMNALRTPDNVEKALSGAELRPVQFMNKTFAEMAVAVAGDNLALFAKVREPNVEPVDPPWMGSSIEMFGSMPSGDPEHVGQVFLQPATRTQKARATHREDGMPVPSPTIRLKSTLVDGGYTLSALIPLKLLFVDKNAKRFLLESKVNVMPAKDRQVIYGILFAAPVPSVKHTGFGKIIVT